MLHSILPWESPGKLDNTFGGKKHKSESKSTTGGHFAQIEAAAYQYQAFVMVQGNYSANHAVNAKHATLWFGYTFAGAGLPG